MLSPVPSSAVFSRFRRVFLTVLAEKRPRPEESTDFRLTLYAAKLKALNLDLEDANERLQKAVFPASRTCM
jgi:hypothetical protein